MHYLSKHMTIAKIPANFDTNQETIETIHGSILSGAEIPQRGRAGRPAIIFLDVREHVQASHRADSSLEDDG
jgi:hypothetical protein